MAQDRETAASDLRYYWENYGDIERLSGWREALAMFPAAQRAWDNYQYSRRLLELTLKYLPIEPPKSEPTRNGDSNSD